jgi:S-adenosylmethionine-dependent methyltransferase
MDDVSDIRAWYDRGEGDEPRLDEHHLEWDLTWRYLNRYLPAEGRVLELGAATGRYTRELARRGYHVTALDLSPNETALAQQKARELGLEGRIRYVVGDARHLSALVEAASNTAVDDSAGFDAALVMGPLYHLIREADRRLVLRQVRALLRAGAPIFTAFICRYCGLLAEMLRDQPEWILDRDEVSTVLELGRDPMDYPHGGFRGYFARPQEIVPLHESEGYATLVLAAVEPVIGADDERYNRLGEPLRSALLDVMEQVSTEPSVLGASRHLLYVGHKNG